MTTNINKSTTKRAPERIFRKKLLKILRHTVFAADSYKTNHAEMYPKQAVKSYSNITNRSGKHLPEAIKRYTGNKCVAFGIQGALDEFHRRWNKFFNARFDRMEPLIRENAEGFVYQDHIDNFVSRWKELHDLGHMPLLFKAVQDGDLVDFGVPVLCVTNTNDKFVWLTNYAETQISFLLWKPMTIATIAYGIKQNLIERFTRTGAPLELVPYFAHDFSARGQPGTPGLELTGHLTSFVGSDTMAAALYVKGSCYNPPKDHRIAGSVVATEHGVTCAYVAMHANIFAGEERFVHDLLDTFPNGIISVVADTWNLWNFINRIKSSQSLREKILNRNGKLVIRPDSGDPYRIINGYKLEEVDITLIDRVTYYEVKKTGKAISYEEYLGVARLLHATFPGKRTSEGFYTLHDNVGIIYGDGINPETMDRIMQGLEENKFSAATCVFGVGSYTYQMVSRDTLGTAIKMTAITLDNGRTLDLQKDPVTDHAKKSHKGIIAVNKVDGKWVYKDEATPKEFDNSSQKVVYVNGAKVNSDYWRDLKQIREALDKA